MLPEISFAFARVGRDRASRYGEGSRLDSTKSRLLQLEVVGNRSVHFHRLTGKQGW